MMLASTSLAQSVAGSYATKPDTGGARNAMCIANAPGNGVFVAIDTAYCPGPSPECFNVRIGSIGFDGTMPFAIESYDQSNSWLKLAGMLQAISPEHHVGMNA
ncbi:hypothetical protein [Ralstonia solanacearum]|uniref:hypothetical protein n=1 Tax=Ralstonia solanacearum TaxID=305 RepID=UPI00202A8782|nr:hypothetical protein [Ralstonia solanacearum]MCL9844167.1 hypothetical protein [Ralstonia solanacearum]MDC6255030.1 hypothetical protein [Ralstonia solanacearum]MDC6259443.1 hypothetical protein [Ralstonia solanacearum]MDC6304407.1 hypothetical protein [Ralstonia solanacearum]